MTSLKSWILTASLSAASLLFAATPASADTILFVGNSFTFAAYSPVWRYRSASVTDLNGEGVGGVPALFKLFSDETGLHYDVSLETSPGKDLQWHIDHKTPVLDRAWDHVILQSFSTLDAKAPGDPTSLIASTAVLAKMFHDKNPAVDIRMNSTWSRADLTYQPSGHWYGQPISTMEQDVYAGYAKAAAASPFVHGAIPVGGAWNRAIETGFAAPNPYQGIAYGKVDLWAFDNYHASTFGYYIEALMIFGAVTGRDPRTLGAHETAAMELGLSPAQAGAMQQIAFDELAAAKP
jgi:hypothetical protein